MVVGDFSSSLSDPDNKVYTLPVPSNSQAVRGSGHLFSVPWATTGPDKCGVEGIGGGDCKMSSGGVSPGLGVSVKGAAEAEILAVRSPSFFWEDFSLCSLPSLAYPDASYGP